MKRIAGLTEPLHAPREPPQAIRILREPPPEVLDVRVAHRVEPAHDRRRLDVVARELRGVRHLRDERLAADERRV